ncbi:hypothetical protein COY23_02850 [bacterium (Candidatus Torokbacteria) CG_4_10_14_0_2_um_filter_35_8]|nr:MAG: hypothetical protein COY23_02850 [bacterium (Candidatus Torokbacteria) CG_4_10_14_0_2_um_filter_35_8]
MAIISMQKVNIIGFKEDERKILKFLQEKGLMEIIEKEEALSSNELGGKSEEEIDTYIARTSFALEFLDGLEKEKQNFIDAFLGAKIKVSKKKFNKVLRNFKYDKVLNTCERIDDEIARLKEETKNQEKEKELLFSWEDFPYRFSEVGATDKVALIFGTIPQSEKDKLVTKINSKLPCTHVQVIKRDKSEAFLMIVFLKKEENNVNNFLREFNFNERKLSYDFDATAKERIEEIDKEIASLQKRINSQKQKAIELLRYRLDLKCFYDSLLLKRNAEDTKRKFTSTEKVLLISGWIAKDNFRFLKENLAKISQNTALIEVKPRRGEEAPVAIHNKGIITPFEAVTKIYGMPKSTELDPTPFLSFFFILFFGVCLSDAGYGILLMILSRIALRKLDLGLEGKKLIKLLFYGGISTLIVGALFGSWFGASPDIFPESFGAIKTFLLKIKLIDPVKNPVNVLILSLALGILQIIFGIGVSMYGKILKKDYKNALLTDALWIIFIVLLVFFALTNVGVLPSTLQVTSKLLVIISTVGLVLTQGRHQKNIFLKIGSGVLSLYKVIGYLSDTLSYSRLLALGLSTAIIGIVVNMVAQLCRDMIPYVGVVVMALILIGGHLFNLAISSLGSFIHSGRLQFVEFFTKFLEGGGNTFKPFRRETKYIEIGD